VKELRQINGREILFARPRTENTVDTVPLLLTDDTKRRIPVIGTFRT
jgi:hypothetical protein